MPGMEIKRTTVKEIFASPEFKRLSKEYAAESQHSFMCGRPLEAEYEAAEEAGRLVVAGAYDEGRLVGFVSVVVFRLLHYQEPFASVESIFLDKAHRQGFAGLQLLDAAKAIAKDSGAVALNVGTRAGSRFEKLCARLFEPVNVVYSVKL